MDTRKRIVRIVLFGAAALILSAAGARIWIARFETRFAAGASGDPSEGFAFLDDVQSNASRVPAVDAIAFVDLEGNRVALADYLGKKNVVLVFTRGFPGYICPFCMTQTSRLITNYDRFQAQDAEVLVVFPGRAADAQKLIAQSKHKARQDEVPFPLVLDEDFRAVDALGIRGDLARPATYIFDKQGELRFAYVGQQKSDRPSIKAMLDQLELIKR
jgi:peroxiredoxin